MMYTKSRENSFHKKGFTLIELLVVISIIAVLLSILMPALTKAKKLAKSVVCKSNLRQIHIAMATYEVNNNDMLFSYMIEYIWLIPIDCTFQENYGVF